MATIIEQVQHPIHSDIYIELLESEPGESTEDKYRCALECDSIRDLDAQELIEVGEWIVATATRLWADYPQQPNVHF